MKRYVFLKFCDYVNDNVDYIAESDSLDAILELYQQEKEKEYIENQEAIKECLNLYCNTNVLEVGQGENIDLRRVLNPDSLQQFDIENFLFIYDREKKELLEGNYREDIEDVIKNWGKVESI